MKKIAWTVLISVSCCRLWAATLHVDLNNAAPVAPYDSWATAATNIQDAVNAAVAGDTIRIADGHYLLASEISVTNAITIQSESGPEATLVDGQGTVRGFNLGNSACVIEGLTITNGYSSGNGGGIYCSETTPVVTNCTISGNSAGNGGGMYSGTANNCTISGNSANNGGGKYYGMANNCTISGNSANSYGGGMRSGTANNCTISVNSALYGGGMYDGTAKNSTISGNSANYGGGMSRGWAANCIVSGNSASSGGGGMNGGTANNCIVWDNDAPTGRNLYSTTARFTCSPDVADHGLDGNITDAPMLLSSSHIATNSPCRGAGSATYASGTDIDGEEWLNPPSMGCDEYHGFVTGALQVAIACSAYVVEGHPMPIQGHIKGALNRHIWDFGDGTLLTNSHLATHAWSSPGTYALILTAYNDTYPSGVSVTQAVQVISSVGTSIYVSGNGNDANDGSSWNSAKATIQAGIDAQQYYGGNVWISNGTYAVSNEISVTKEVYVRSVNGPESTIVDGQGSVRCFNLGNSACVIDGLTITNGYISGNGGGIYCSGATPIATNCIISGNSAYNGGGMSDGTADNCTISGNSAGLYGGGMYYGTANNCTISGNSANSKGGGMRGSTANNCTIGGNSASWTGGGMDEGTANNCTITANSAQYGGGMLDSTVKNCTISGNSASSWGGGMGGGRANNCTISGNSAGSIGGGMDSGAAINCIVWFNEAPNGKNLYFTAARFTCSPDVTHGVDGNITNAPGFIDAANGDFRLMSNSSCINWGNNSYASGTLDLDGQPRIVGDYVDMGAYEYQGAMVPDQNGDGIPDEWKRTWFGYNVDPAGNPDGDAFSNLDEYIAGTDPTDPASYFAVTNALPSASGFVVEWPAVEGREYTVLWTPELTNTTQVLQDNIAHPQSSYTDTVHDAESAGFYQVEVRMQ